MSILFDPAYIDIVQLVDHLFVRNGALSSKDFLEMSTLFRNRYVATIYLNSLAIRLLQTLQNNRHNLTEFIDDIFCSTHTTSFPTGLTNQPSSDNISSDIFVDKLRKLVHPEAKITEFTSTRTLLFNTIITILYTVAVVFDNFLHALLIVLGEAIDGKLVHGPIFQEAYTYAKSMSIALSCTAGKTPLKGMSAERPLMILLDAVINLCPFSYTLPMDTQGSSHHSTSSDKLFSASGPNSSGSGSSDIWSKQSGFASLAPGDFKGGRPASYRYCNDSLDSSALSQTDGFSSATAFSHLQSPASATKDSDNVLYRLSQNDFSGADCSSSDAPIFFNRYRPCNGSTMYFAHTIDFSVIPHLLMSFDSPPDMFHAIESVFSCLASLTLRGKWGSNMPANQDIDTLRSFILVLLGSSIANVYRFAILTTDPKRLKRFGDMCAIPHDVVRNLLQTTLLLSRKCHSGLTSIRLTQRLLVETRHKGFILFVEFLKRRGGNFSSPRLQAYGRRAILVIDEAVAGSKYLQEVCAAHTAQERPDYTFYTTYVLAAYVIDTALCCNGALYTNVCSLVLRNFDVVSLIMYCNFVEETLELLQTLYALTISAKLGDRSRFSKHNATESSQTYAELEVSLRTKSRSFIAAIRTSYDFCNDSSPCDGHTVSDGPPGWSASATEVASIPAITRSDDQSHLPDDVHTHVCELIQRNAVVDVFHVSPIFVPIIQNTRYHDVATASSVNAPQQQAGTRPSTDHVALQSFHDNRVSIVKDSITAYEGSLSQDSSATPAPYPQQMGNFASRQTIFQRQRSVSNSSNPEALPTHGTAGVSHLSKVDFDNTPSLPSGSPDCESSHTFKPVQHSSDMLSILRTFPHLGAFYNTLDTACNIVGANNGTFFFVLGSDKTLSDVALLLFSRERPIFNPRLVPLKIVSEYASHYCAPATVAELLFRSCYVSNPSMQTPSDRRADQSIQRARQEGKQSLTLPSSESRSHDWDGALTWSNRMGSTVDVLRPSTRQTMQRKGKAPEPLLVSRASSTKNIRVSAFSKESMQDTPNIDFQKITLTGTVVPHMHECPSQPKLGRYPSDAGDAYESFFGVPMRNDGAHLSEVAQSASFCFTSVIADVINHTLLDYQLLNSSISAYMIPFPQMIDQFSRDGSSFQSPLSQPRIQSMGAERVTSHSSILTRPKLATIVKKLGIRNASDFTGGWTTDLPHKFMIYLMNYSHKYESIMYGRLQFKTLDPKDVLSCLYFLSDVVLAPLNANEKDLPASRQGPTASGSFTDSKSMLPKTLSPASQPLLQQAEAIKCESIPGIASPMSSAAYFSRPMVHSLVSFSISQLIVSEPHAQEESVQTMRPVHLYNDCTASGTQWVSIFCNILAPSVHIKAFAGDRIAQSRNGNNYVGCSCEKCDTTRMHDHICDHYLEAEMMSATNHDCTQSFLLIIGAPYVVNNTEIKIPLVMRGIGFQVRILSHRLTAIIDGKFIPSISMIEATRHGQWRLPLLGCV